MQLRESSFWAVLVLLLLGCGCDDRSARVSASDGLLFSHAVHLDRGDITCTDCHTAITSSTRASDNNLPSEETCLECHENHPDTSAECRVCHLDPADARPLENRSRPVRFNHQLHVAFDGLPDLLRGMMAAGEYPVETALLEDQIESGLICTACHRGLDQMDFAEAAAMPMMWDCMVCHRSEQPQEECSLCHRPDFSLLPGSHEVKGFFDAHPDHKEEQPVLCKNCHAVQNIPCIQCH